MKIQGLLPKNSFTHKFFLISTRVTSDDKMSLYCRILINRTKTDFSLDMEVDPNDWDHEQGRYLPTNKHNRYLNQKLSEAQGKIEGVYDELVKHKVKISAAMLKDGYRGKSYDHSDYTLLSFLDYFIKEAYAKPQVYGRPTIQHYETLKFHLVNFLKSHHLKDIPLESFNRNMLDRFENWLLSWKHPILCRPMNENTKNNYLKKLKCVINNAIRKEILFKSPFIGFTLKEIKGKKVFLSDEELTLIKNHDLGGNPSLIKVRDIFLFSVYTGLRWSDALSLRTENISKGDDNNLWITLNQVKTKDPLHIPLLKPARNIYAKYERQRENTGFVLPRLSSQKTNLNLKIIADIVGIQKKLTHHTARHTFATTITLGQGVDIKTVSFWLGHASVKTTEIYAQVSKLHLSNTAMKLNQAMK